MSSENSDLPGYIDTNVFIHALAGDEHAAECEQFLFAVRRGQVRVRLHPLVVHELTYALPRYLQQMKPGDVAEFVMSVLAWQGMASDDPYIGPAIRAWSQMPSAGFVDAYLSVASSAQDAVVYTKNIAHFRALGSVPLNPLPTPGPDDQ